VITRVQEALPEARAELDLRGMTCASCATRIERKLNRLDGVRASVNYATERAEVEYDPTRVSRDELVGAVRAAGYDASVPGAASQPDTVAAADDRELRLRLAWSAVLTLPVVLLAMVSALQFDYWQWVSLALATPVVLWGGWPFHRAALANLRHGAATMDTLISLGTMAAWGWSVVALLALDAGDPGMRMTHGLLPADGDAASQVYLEVAAGVVTLILLGRWLEARAKRRSGDALRSLLELGAKQASVLRDDAEVLVPVQELRAGDRFVVRPGEKIATDGVVEDGRSAVDMSLLTGESVPVDVGPGSEVAGATVNASGRLLIRATRVGAETALAQITLMVGRAQAGKAPVQRLADRVSGVFVPVVILIALGTLVGWLATGHSAAAAFTAAVAVLIIACPCALGLATPTALMVGTGRGAQLGIVISGPEILESTRRTSAIVLDKTGTVTEASMRVVDLAAAPGVEAPAALRLAGAAEAGSEHPIAQAIVQAARAEERELPRPERFESRAGLGVSALVEGHVVEVGRAGRNGPLADALATARSGGRTPVEVRVDGAPVAILSVADRVKPTSAQAVAELRRLGLRPVLLTGDAEPVARAVAAEVGIEEVIAEVMPEGKAAVVSALQERGEVVAMVGDGVNDAPALAQADLGLAIGTGTDVAIEASDITLVSGDLRAAADAIRLSRRTLATIKGNLFWAFAYNVAAIPAAALGYLNPLIAGAAMAFSSLFVVGNSLRLRGFRSVR